MPSDAIEVRVDGPVGTVTLGRPDHGNALTRAMIAELRTALDDLYREKRVRAVVLTGRGEAFCLGRDVGEQAAESTNPADDLARWGAEAEEYRDLVAAMLELPKPIVAAVSGPAEAGGAGLVLASDVAVGCPGAGFGFPEPRRGVVAGVAAPLLAWRLGAGAAARLLLTSETISAEEAHRIGVYHELVGADLVWARASEVGNQAAQAAPEAVQLTKRLLWETIGEQLATQLSNGAIASAMARTTEAAKEGLNAHLGDREPEWP
ncbi:enoyl-CoA hydratase/isomerase family protein [Pseudobythopirellula maris]|nr:enoyl-CoA hydratase/isomerase family protein [Pseudobythopirellula maris]